MGEGPPCFRPGNSQKDETSHLTDVTSGEGTETAPKVCDRNGKNTGAESKRRRHGSETAAPRGIFASRRAIALRPAATPPRKEGLPSKGRGPTRQPVSHLCALLRRRAGVRRAAIGRAGVRCDAFRDAEMRYVRCVFAHACVHA